MKKFILGTKVGMTQIFQEDGTCIPVTVVEAGPCAVVQKKTKETDDYEAIKLAYVSKDKKKLNKPDRGLFDKLDMEGYRFLKEFRPDDISGFEVGQVVSVADMFQDGDHVDISGTSKGKGYAGPIKRHGMKIGPKSHGSKYHRGNGSMGANTDPGKVFKGKKMPGQMGAERVTIQNLEIVKVDADQNIILVKGAVPGPKKSLVMLKESVKA